MEVEIKMLEGMRKGKTYVYTEYQKITIGRHPKSTFSFPEDKKLSRTHCVLEIAPPSSCFLQDMNSSNGTYIGYNTGQNKITFQKINEVILKSGVYIKTGSCIFSVTWKEIPQAFCQKCNALVPESQLGENVICIKCQEKEKDIVGKTFGPFTVIKKIGEGNMGIVYLVEHTQTKTPYAVKIARPSVQAQQENIERFLREASCGVQIKHPNVIRYYPPKYIENGQFFYIPMEYVNGIDIKNYLRKRGKSWDVQEAKEIIFQILEGLSCLHEHKIVHRDIKPENIMLVEEESGHLLVKILDFGLAKNYEESGMSGLTLSNRAMGTPDFMSPEQLVNSRDVDPRCDIYSIGATIYYMLTFRTVFIANTLNDMAAQILNEEPAPIQKISPQIPSIIAQIVMKCLQKDPDDRYQTINDLKAAFTEAYQSLPRK